MQLNRNEWSQAQDLLLKLVQVLSPLAECDEPISVILNKRFFYVPPALGEETPLTRSVRLLSTLHSVQKQVEEIIGEEPAAPFKPEKKEERGPVLSKQAQKLIDQVQDAIGKLCTSTQIKDPKEEPLRSALRRLKPNLDQIIEEVAQNETPTEREGTPPFRFTPTRSPREELIRKLLPFPETEIGVPKGGRPAEITRPVEAKRPDETDPVSEIFTSTGKKTADATLIPVSQSKPLQQESEQIDVKPLARNALPATSIVPLTRQLTPALKKKKRKGFWFSEKEEEDRNNP